MNSKPYTPGITGLVPLYEVEKSHRLSQLMFDEWHMHAHLRVITFKDLPVSAWVTASTANQEIFAEHHLQTN